jgi:type II secretory pathway component GspD/PulD (secretin)
MKTQHIVTIILATFTTAWLAAAADDPTNAPATDPATTNAPVPDASTTDAPPANETVTNAPATNAPPDAANADQPATPADNEPTPTNGLVLNFHDAPLSAVLSYLSAKAGLIIESDVNLQGKVNVVSRQPITTNDIVDVLNDQLSKNGFAAILVGRRLTIMTVEQAKTFAGTPVHTAKSFTEIPMDDAIVTEILPLQTLQAQQLVKDLDLLIPRTATVTANEAANSVIMTAPQKDIRRIDEIIHDLDGSALSQVVVTPLTYADSKSVAAELKEVFQSEDSQVTGASTRNNFRRGGGGGRGGGFNPMAAAMGMGGGPGGGNASDDASKNVSTHAVFVSDDQLNAVISSAPPDYMRLITNVIADLDKPSLEITVMRVFHLTHADPGEIADELTAMFPSTTSTDQNNRTAGFRFGPFGGGGQQNAAASLSPKMKRETTVVAVADRRTQSVIVSASKDMMEQIDGVVKDLDQGDQGDQVLTALDFGGADPATVEQTMSGLFASSTSKAPTSTQTATPLANRYTGNANSMSTTTTSSSTGTGAGGGTAGVR